MVLGLGWLAGREPLGVLKSIEIMCAESDCEASANSNLVSDSSRVVVVRLFINVFCLSVVDGCRLFVDFRGGCWAHSCRESL